MAAASVQISSEGKLAEVIIASEGKPTRVIALMDGKTGSNQCEGCGEGQRRNRAGANLGGTEKRSSKSSPRVKASFGVVRGESGI